MLANPIFWSIDQDVSVRAIIPGVPIYTPGGAKPKIKKYVYVLTEELYEAFSSTGYTFKSMKKD